jgi:nitric oxide reductase NorQ protein
MSIELRNKIIEQFTLDKEQTISRLAKSTMTDAADVRAVLSQLKKEAIVDKVGRSGWVLLVPNLKPSNDNPLIPSNVTYIDHSGVLSKLRKAYDMGMHALLIGPAGVGKTAAIQKVAEMAGVPMRTTNFSLRTREHHFIGRLDTKHDGTLYFKRGPLIESMLEGGIWYGDEINTAESDCLVRLDSALDHRRNVEAEGEFYQAAENFWAVSSINPLDRYHPGTKELPGQLLSRYEIKIHVSYPEPQIEYTIIKEHVPKVAEYSTTMMDVLDTFHRLRDSAELPYHPTIRESITVAKLLVAGLTPVQALTMSFVDVYTQWGVSTARQVEEFIQSRMADVMFQNRR